MNAASFTSKEVTRRAVQMCYDLAHADFKWYREFRKMGDLRYAELSLRSGMEYRAKGKQVMREAQR